MEIRIFNSQRVWRPSLRSVKALLHWVVTAHPAPPSVNSLDVLMTDDSGMREQNWRYFSKDETTDVISCLYPPMTDTTGSHADIIINVELARDTIRTAKQLPKGWSLSSELMLYLFHGWDHVCGADDATPAGRRSMRRRELGWIREARKRGLTL